MRTRAGLWWAALACGLVASHADCLAQAPAVPDNVVASVQARVDHGYNVSIVVGIVNPQGTTYYAYGKTAVSGDEHPNERTVFEIGSVTKVFTSVLLADMVERGEVALDDPIERFLPDSVKAPTRNGRSITLEHLATQTSGLPRMPSNFAPADAANPYADYSVKQMYDFLSSYTLRRDIGARYEYSNYGVGLLGHILTLRAGMDYEELVKERIADVLGMPDTRITLTPEMRSRLAIGHSGSQEVSNWDIPTLAGAGALRSTAQDMLVFLAANLDLTETPLRAALEMTREARHEAGGPRMHIGLGWHIRTGGEHEVVWHNGGTGGYRSFAGFVEETHTGVVVLTNTDMSADDIGFHMLDASIPLREIRVPVAVDPAILDQYVGRYALTPQAIVEVTVDDGKLFTQLTGQPRFQIYPESETEFFLTVVDAQLTFVRDESGKVSAVTLHQNGANLTATRLP